MALHDLASTYLSDRNPFNLTLLFLAKVNLFLPQGIDTWCFLCLECPYLLLHC